MIDPINIRIGNIVRHTNEIGTFNMMVQAVHRDGVDVSYFGAIRKLSFMDVDPVPLNFRLIALLFSVAGNIRSESKFSSGDLTAGVHLAEYFQTDDNLKGEYHIIWSVGYISTGLHLMTPRIPCADLHTLQNVLMMYVGRPVVPDLPETECWYEYHQDEP